MLPDALLPILVYFLIGVVLRRTGLAKAEDAAFLFRLILYVTLPALSFEAISGVTLTPALVLLPVTGFAVNLVCMSAAVMYARAKALPPRQSGALVLGAAITNGVFIFTFILAALGRQALAEAILVDLGNAVFVATFAYSAAGHYGSSQQRSVFSSVAKTFRSPLFVALAMALFFALSKRQPPEVLSRILSPLGGATIPLTIIALGILFSRVSLRDRLPVRTLLLRMPLGLASGFLFVWLFGFEGTTAVVVLVAAAAPIGFSSLTLAAVANLDSSQAAAALSLSVAVGLASTTSILWVALAWLGAG